MSAAVSGRAGRVSVEVLLSLEGAASEMVSAGIGPGVGFEDGADCEAGGETEFDVSGRACRLAPGILSMDVRRGMAEDLLASIAGDKFSYCCNAERQTLRQKGQLCALQETHRQFRCLPFGQ